MGLKNKIDSLYVATLGNRVTVISALTYANGWRSLNHDDNINLKITCGIGGLIGGFFLGATYLGISTWKHYKRTLREAQEQGKVEVEFFQKRIERNENGKLMGYCQIQGLYLGAKRTGSLEQFYQAREQFSNNIIPNF